MTAFQRLLNAAHSLALGSDQVVEQSPPEYDTLQGTARLDAALPAAGAFDAAPIEIPTGGRKFLELYCFYDENGGGVLGSVTLRLEKCITIGGVDQWARDALIDPQAVVPGADSVTPTQRDSWDYEPTGIAEESYIYTFDIARCDKFRVPCAESGQVGSPGDMIVYYKLSN
jgi:hypothetical protein